MTRDEAKLLLQAMRPDGSDANDPAFAEALALARTDAELQAWWEAEQKFDRVIAAKLGEVPTPPDLRDTILGKRKVLSFPSAFQIHAFLAAAAVFLFVAVIHNAYFAGPSPIASGEYKESAIAALHDDKPDLAMLSPDHAKLQAWLKMRNAPMGSLPPSVSAMPSVGCETLSVEGHAVTLICFAMNGGGVAHLFMVDKSALADPPADFSPAFGSHEGGWSTAMWSDGKMSYILATRAGPDKLKALL